MDQRVAVVGLGLIGGSLAGAARAAGYTVQGYDPSPDAARIAAARTLVDETSPDLASCLAAADLVLIAAPVSATLDVLPAVDGLAESGAIILDVASVKSAITDVMAGLPGAARCIGGHPITGKETSGPAAADPALTIGRPFVLCPSPATSDDTVARARAFVQALGFLPRLTAPALHDQILARTSHLPQLLSSALALSLQPSDACYAGPGLRDMVRLARSNPALWREIVAQNGPNILAAVRSLHASLDSLTALIEAQEWDTLEEAMAGASSRLDPKKVSS